MAHPKRYLAEHITPGLVDYVEDDKRERVLVGKDVLDKMNPSFIGKPVFNFIHKVIDPETAFNFSDEERDKQAVGVVSDVGYNAETGYYTTELMIWDEETIKNIDEKGFSVSCAYLPKEGPGGTHNNVPYDSEVIGGEYHHMAIVDNPRYEGARIFPNSKSGGIMKFKPNFGKDKVRKNQAEPVVEEEKPEEETMDMNADAVLVTEDGQEIPVSELVANYKAMNKNMDEEEKPVINMEDTVEVDGKEVPVKDLYDSYMNGCGRTNAEPPTDEPLEDVVDEKMNANSADDPKKKNENFKLIQNAASRGAEKEKPVINTERKRIAVGKARYGSAVQNGGKE